MKMLSALALLLLVSLLGSCVSGQGITKTKDGGWMVHNGVEVFWKAKSMKNHLVVTMPDGTKVEMDREAVEPDGTEATKFGQQNLIGKLGKYSAHSTDLKTTTEGAIKLKGTKDPNVIPVDPNVIPADPNVIPK